VRQNRHNLKWTHPLPFPKFNEAVFILTSEAKALLELFDISRTQLVELLKWQG